MGRTLSETYTSTVTLTSTSDNPVNVTGTIITDAGYGLYALGGAPNAWSITNSGTILGSTIGGGIALGNVAAPYGSPPGNVYSSTITNLAGGLISGDVGVHVISYQYAGQADLVVNMAGGTITGYSAGVDLESANDATVTNFGLISQTGTSSDGAIFLPGGGLVINEAGATISGQTEAIFSINPTTVVNSGTLIAGGNLDGGRLIVTPGAAFIKLPTAASYYHGALNGGLGSTLELMAAAGTAGAVASLGDAITNFSQVQFDPGGQWTLSGNGSRQGLGTASILGFAAGDTIEVTGFAATSDTFTGAGLVLSNGSSNQTISIEGSFTTGDFLINNDGSDTLVTLNTACFAAGTRLATAQGDISVEDLKPGDLVHALLGNALLPVVWLGHRRVVCRRHPRPRTVWPVRIAAHAFGHNIPRRDVLLSPDHAVYLLDVLVPIKHLINGSSISQVAVEEVVYYHIELPQHDIVLAEGLPTESYLDTGDRSSFRNDGDTMRLFPDFCTHHPALAHLWEARGCAPLIVGGARLAAARNWIAGQMHRTACTAAA